MWTYWSLHPHFVSGSTLEPDPAVMCTGTAVMGISLMTPAQALVALHAALIHVRCTLDFEHRLIPVHLAQLLAT
jgi:hypothetical protein